MAVPRHYTLSKEERICSRTLIERLFNGGGSRSMSAFPIRVVFMQCERVGDEPQAKILVSVPKKCFKRAVKRNRVKRQIREAYRKNKYEILDPLAEKSDVTMAIAFIWLDDKLHDSTDVELKIKNLLSRIKEKI